MNTPLNPDALKAGLDAGHCAYAIGGDQDDVSRAAITGYLLAAAQPVVNSVESLPAKMRMLAWEGGEIEIGEIPEGHVLVGFEMATDRAWSMADKVTIRIERKDTTNGR